MTEQQNDPNAGEEIPEEVQQLHLCALMLAQHLVPGEGEEFKPFEPEFIDSLDEWLQELAVQHDGAEEFIHAVHTIGAFGAGNSETSPRMHAQLQALLERTTIANAIKKWHVSADPEEVKAIADRFGNFSGADSQKKAPGVGEEKPDGALDLNQLNFPKRL